MSRSCSVLFLSALEVVGHADSSQELLALLSRKGTWIGDDLLAVEALRLMQTGFVVEQKH